MARFDSALLVEDDPITVMVCERIINMLSFAGKVRSASNGQEALDLIRQIHKDMPDQMPDIIFLDINMPVMNGWEFLDNFDQVTSLFSKPPAIYILSSTVDPQDFKKAESYDFVRSFISKPLTKDALERLS